MRLCVAVFPKAHTPCVMRIADLAPSSLLIAGNIIVEVFPLDSLCVHVVVS